MLWRLQTKPKLDNDSKNKKTKSTGCRLNRLKAKCSSEDMKYLILIFGRIVDMHYYEVLNYNKTTV